jgi:hypothetical protein
MRSAITKIRAYAQVLPRAKRNHTDLIRWMVRRPQLLAGIGAYEAGLFTAARAGDRAKSLAQLRVSSLIGCPF